MLYNNYSTVDNTNPYTGQSGTVILIFIIIHIVVVVVLLPMVMEQIIKHHLMELELTIFKSTILF